MCRNAHSNAPSRHRTSLWGLLPASRTAPVARLPAVLTLLAILSIVSVAAGQDVPSENEFAYAGRGPSLGLTTDVFREIPIDDSRSFHPSFELRIPKFLHGHPDDPQRHIGRGSPLQGTSWLNRPYHADWLVGSRFKSQTIAENVRQNGSLFGGYRWGQDFDHYWGRELEFTFARPVVETAAGSALGLNRDWGLTGTILYYPWGDSRWRPYARWGLGLEHMDFNNANGQGIEEFLIVMPVGGGIKYHVDRWLALRLDLTDQVAFGAGGVTTSHQLSLTFGIEAHYGGPRRRYR
jgi:hypothetical protein